MAPMAQENPQASKSTEASGRAPAANSGAAAVGAGVRNLGNQRRMVSELERINALNLEPSLPKESDGNRNVSRLSQNRDMLKSEFQQFLKVMKNNDNLKANKEKQPAAPNTSTGASQGGDRPGPAPAGAQGASSKSSVPSPPFTVENKHSTPPTLGGILEEMLRRASSGAPVSEVPDWPDASGGSYHDALGRPTGKAQLPPGMAQMGGGNFSEVPENNTRQGNAPAGAAADVRPPAGGGSAPQGMRPQMGSAAPQGTQPPHGMQPPQGYVMAGAGPPNQGGQPQMQMFQMPGMVQGDRKSVV